jgi:hypothetical protein
MPISATALRALDAAVRQGRPALGGASKLTTGGGTAHVRDDDDWFLVKITDSTGTGASAVYSFTEQMVEPNVGDVIDRGSPRYAHKDRNPGRCVLAAHTFVVDDVCLARRAVGSPNEWELLPIGAGADTTFLVLLTERDFTGTFVKYAAVEVEATGSVTYAVKSGGRTFGFGEGETPLYQQRNMLHPVVGVDGGGAPNFVKKGSVVRVWTGPDGIHFFKALAPVVPLRRTGNEGTVGETAYIRENRNDDPGAPTWVDGDEVEVVPVE